MNNTAIATATRNSATNGTRSARAPPSPLPLKLQKRIRLTISSAAIIVTASAT